MAKKNPFSHKDEHDEKSSKYIHEPKNWREEERRRMDEMKPNRFMRSFELKKIRKLFDSLIKRKK